MEEQLFIQTGNGQIPIDCSIAEKYHLKKGTKTPFSQGCIVNAKGEYIAEPTKDEKAEPKETEGEKSAVEGDVILTTSEIIDFAQGADS